MGKVTNNEGEILAWAQRNEAHPVERAPFRPDSEPAQLVFVFGSAPMADEHLRPIEWQRFFAIFHMMGLVLAIDGGRNYELMKLEGRKSGRFEGKPVEA